MQVPIALITKHETNRSHPDSELLEWGLLRNVFLQFIDDLPEHRRIAGKHDLGLALEHGISS